MLYSVRSMKISVKYVIQRKTTLKLCVENTIHTHTHVYITREYYAEICIHKMLAELKCKTVQ